MVQSLPYGLLLIAAVLSASLAGQRATIAGGIIAAGWAFYNAAWWGRSPAAFIGIDEVDLWAMTDMLIGATMLWFGRDRWWGVALWALFVMQGALHIPHQYGGLAFAPYSKALDTLFLAQLAVLFMTGGGRLVDYLSDCLRHVRHVLRSPSAAPRKAQAE